MRVAAWARSVGSARQSGMTPLQRVRQRVPVTAAPEGDRITLVPLGEHRHTLLLLHGFHMSAPDLLHDALQLQKRRPGWRIVLPQAPSLRITAHGGAVASSWFDYLTDHEGAQEDAIDIMGLRVRRAELLPLLQAEAALLGDWRKLHIGGYSQGGTLALDIATRCSLGGVVTLAAPRLSVSMTRPLLCPWHALFATHDEIFPERWAAPLMVGAIATKCVADHGLEGVDSVAFLDTTLQKFEEVIKD